MNAPPFYTIALGLLVGLFSSPSAHAASTPNIVLIFIDDIGYGDIGPFGSTKNRTPNLDRMAQQGMKFTSFYAAPVCSVSRAQVNTGCYGQRVSIPGVFPPASRNGINAAEHTTAELLKAQGYATMIIGKWHLGDQPEFLPTRHGFDHYFGLPYSNDMNKHSTQKGEKVVPLMRDEKVIELLTGPDQDQLTERYTEEALKFIRENQSRPFYLYLPHTAVHVPIHPGDKFKDKSKNGRYGDWVEEVDWSVGRVLDTLRELKLDSNTLVVFSSDNGPWLVKGADAGEAGPLRGGKGSTWEGGVREPTLAWWPGRIVPGTVCDAVAGNIDFLPTFVKLAGGSVPTDRKIDGRDFSPLLFGTSKESQREAHYYYHGYKLEAVRVRSWKLALSPQAEGMGLKKADSDAAKPGLRLYNLDSDIGERTNLASAHPDIVKRLQDLAAKMAAELGDGKPGPEVRLAGQVENPVLLYPSDDVPKARKGKGKAAAAKGAHASTALEALKIGDVLDAEEALQIANRPITITCDVEPKAKNGVIIAHGGSAVGYALYLKEGKVMFTVHSGAKTKVNLTASETPSGRLAMVAQLTKDGTMTLSLNGKLVATGKAESLIARQPQENFCVGHDDKVTVGDYDGKTLFQGTIENLKVTTNP
ncbi:MAG: sulfatase [Verrucomicrobiota bacterium]